MSREYVYEFTGSAIDMELEPGVYKFQVWGAQGNATSGGTAGQGGYSIGTYTVTEKSNIKIYVGGQNGWNGGGHMNTTRSGGGASDIRLNGDAYTDRIIVAGGGGGSAGGVGGNGGGLNAGHGLNYGGSDISANGATQDSGYSLGVGQSYHNVVTEDDGDVLDYTGPGAGGGYYGGYGCWSYYYKVGGGLEGSTKSAAGGGSGYISPILSDASTTAGGRTGNGKIIVTRITYNAYNPSIEGKTVTLSNNLQTDLVESIDIYINDVIVDNINNPQGDVIYTFKNENLNFGLNQIKLIVNMNDGYDYGINYNFTFVNTLEKIPEGSTNTELVADYVENLKKSINTIHFTTQNILSDLGTEFDENEGINSLMNTLISDINDLSIRFRDILNSKKINCNNDEKIFDMIEKVDGITIKSLGGYIVKSTANDVKFYDFVGNSKTHGYGNGAVSGTVLVNFTPSNYTVKYNGYYNISCTCSAYAKSMRIGIYSGSTMINNVDATGNTASLNNVYLAAGQQVKIFMETGNYSLYGFVSSLKIQGTLTQS